MSEFSTFHQLASANIFAWMLYALLGVMAYVGLSIFVVVLAFRKKWPGVFCKRPDGRLPWLAWALYWPYLGYNRLVFHSWRHVATEPAYSEILPGLFLGRRLVPEEQALADKLGPLAVLDLTAEFAEPEFMRRQAAYLCLPTLDMTAPTPETIRSSLQFIRTHLGQRPVYVHCALGHGRSAVIVLAYLLASKQCASADLAYAFAKARRSGVSLTSGQWRVLDEFTPGPA